MLPVPQTFDSRPDTLSSSPSANNIKSTISKNSCYSTRVSISIPSLNEHSKSSTVQLPSHTLPISSPFFRDEMLEVLNAEKKINSLEKSTPSYDTKLPPRTLLTQSKESDMPPQKNFHTSLPSKVSVPINIESTTTSPSTSNSTAIHALEMHASTNLLSSYDLPEKNILHLHSSSDPVVKGFLSSDSTSLFPMPTLNPISSFPVTSNSKDGLKQASSPSTVFVNEVSSKSETCLKERVIRTPFPLSPTLPFSSTTLTPSVQNELLKTPNFDNSKQFSLTTCSEDNNDHCSHREARVTPLIHTSGFPSPPDYLGFPLEDIQSIDRERTSVSPQSVSLSPSLNCKLSSSLARFTLPIGFNNTSPIHTDASSSYHVPLSPSLSKGFPSIESPTSTQLSPTSKREKISGLSPFAALKLTPSLGATPQAKLQRRHSDFGPISSPLNRHHVTSTDVNPNTRLSTQQHPLHQTHSYMTATEENLEVPITPQTASFSSDSWNAGLSKFFFTSPPSNLSQKSRTSSSWSPLFPPEDSVKEIDPIDDSPCEISNEKQIHANAKHLVRSENNPPLKITIPPYCSVDNSTTPHSSMESSITIKSSLPSQFTRYLKISNISVSFPASEKSRLFQSLSEVQHMIHRLVGSSMFCLYLSFYDSRHVLQYLQQVQDPPLKTIVATYRLELKPIHLAEFQESTELNLSESESCSELIVRGVTNESESPLKDLLMFYGEIMSLQRLHQSGCLLVNYFDVRSAEKAFNLLPNLARSLHQIDVTVERPSNVDSADSNTPTSSSCSISKSHTLKVETSNLEAVSFLDTGLIRSINREHNFHSPLSQSLTAAVNINTDNAPKSNSSPSLSSKNLTNSSTNLCGEPLWSTVYPPITRRASEMPYSYSQQQLRNSFMCKAVPAAADDFSTTGMDDFLMKSNGNGLTSPGSAPTNPSSISSEPLVTGLNTSDEFLAEKIISTRGDSPSRTRERSTRHPYLPSTSYPPAMPSFSPPPSVSRTNHTLRLNLGMIDNPSTCASGCKHSSVTMSTNSMSNNQNFHYPHQQSSNSLSYSPSTLTVPSKYEISPSPTHPLHCSPSHSQNSQSHHNHHNQHHHHHHHSNNNNNLRHHHNHYYNSFQGNKKQSNYGYSTCLRSNSALPKIDLIPRENEFELERLLGGKDTRTTIMIRNIPNKYSQQMLLDFINESHKGQYDFLYLRMDFKNRCNVGYAFCNLISVHALCSFAQRVIGKKWTRFNSDKVCMLSYANIQGKQALIEKFRNSSVMDEHPTYRPKIFITSGPFAGGEEVFPLPVNRVPRLISGSSSSVACPSSHLSTSPLEYTHEQHEEKRSYFCDYSTPAYTQFQEYSGYSSASSQLPLDSPLPQY